MGGSGKTARSLMKEALAQQVAGGLFFGMLTDESSLLGQPSKLSDEEVLGRLRRAIRLSSAAASEIEAAFPDA